MRLRHAHRKPTRPVLRRPWRPSLRGCLRGRGGPDDFAQMLTAYGKAIRAHRQLARLAPSFFDAAVVDRERENRAETRRWMAMWEPALAKAYGAVPRPLVMNPELPPLPPRRTQRAVERRLAEMQMWLEAGKVARLRHQQRRPHALPSLSRLARLLQLAFDFKKLALGLDSPNRLPDKITYDYEFTDLKRAYGHLLDPMPPPSGGAMVHGAATDGQCGSHLASRSVLTSDSISVAPPPASEPLSDPVAPVVSVPPPVSPRCDAWSRLARHLRHR